MAIIKEFKLGETTIKVDNTYFPKTEEENQKQYEQFNNTALRILEHSVLEKEKYNGRI